MQSSEQHTLPRAAVVNFGCKANFADGEAIAGELSERARLVRDPAAADLVVLNTCAVTDAAEQEALRWLRRLQREEDPPRVVVTGCAAERNPEAFRALGPRVEVSGYRDRDRVSRQLLGERPDGGVEALGSRGVMPGLPAAPRTLGGTRAFLKVQDGCDHSCGFCVSTHLRGRTVSRPLPEILETLRELDAEGVQELVLTGIQLGQWGRDQRSEQRLVDMLMAILDHSQVPRIRLSSIDPREWTPALTALVVREERICPHFHVPVQSGDPAVLRAMRRAASLAPLEALLTALRARPGVMLGTDMIVGHPGEDEAAFERSLAFVERWFDHVHVFSYSPRPGTPSAGLADLVPPAVIRQRARHARSLAETVHMRFLDALVGSRQPVLVERGVRAGNRVGRTPHWAEVRLPRETLPGQLLAVRIQRREGQVLHGRP